MRDGKRRGRRKIVLVSFQGRFKEEKEKGEGREEDGGG
jgi:hypothetical protein